MRKCVIKHQIIIIIIIIIVLDASHDLASQSLYNAEVIDFETIYLLSR